MRISYAIAILGFVVLSLSVVATTAQAQELKIAVVDIEKMLSDSKAGQSIQNQLASRREAFQKEFSARENNLIQSEKTLLEKKNEMSAEEFAKKREEFSKQLSETRALFSKRRSALDKGLGKALSELRNSIIQVAAEISEEKGYSVVLTRDSVVIVEKEFDITQNVLTRLDAKVSTISLDLAE